MQNAAAANASADSAARSMLLGALARSAVQHERTNATANMRQRRIATGGRRPDIAARQRQRAQLHAIAISDCRCSTRQETARAQQRAWANRRKYAGKVHRRVTAPI